MFHVGLVAPQAGPSVSRIVTTLADGLRARGHRVDTLSFPPPSAQHPGVTPAQAAVAVRSQIDRLVSGWVEDWRRQRPDVVHVEVLGPIGQAAVAAAQGLGIPATSSFHHLPRYAPRQRAQALASVLAAHRRCAATVTENPEDAAALRQHGVGQVTCIGCGVDARLFHPAKRDAALRQSWQAAEDAPVLLWLGRVIPQKVPPLFAAACGAARAVQPATRAVIVGDGSELPRLRQAVPWAVCAGAQTGEALARHIASADLLVFPSQVEGFGQVVTEAMASGLAILAHRVAAAGMHAVDGRHGRIVAPGDVSAFVQGAVELVRDVPAVRAAGAAARATTETLTWDAVVDRWAEFFGEVLSRPKTPSASP